MHTTNKLLQSVNYACRSHKLQELKKEFLSLWRERPSIVGCPALLRRFCSLLDENGSMSESESVYSEGANILDDAERQQVNAERQRKRDRTLLGVVGGVVATVAVVSLLRRRAA